MFSVHEVKIDNKTIATKNNHKSNHLSKKKKKKKKKIGLKKIEN